MRYRIKCVALVSACLSVAAFAALGHIPSAGRGAITVLRSDLELPDRLTGEPCPVAFEFENASGKAMRVVGLEPC